MQIPDTGMTNVINTIAFERALENAIRRGVTVETIAARLETSPESVERWRKRKNSPHPDYCSAIAKVLDKME